MKFIFSIFIFLLSCSAYAESGLLVGYAGYGVKNLITLEDALKHAVSEFGEQCMNADKIDCAMGSFEPQCLLYDKDDLKNIERDEVIDAFICISTLLYSAGSAGLSYYNGATLKVAVGNGVSVGAVDLMTNGAFAVGLGTLGNLNTQPDIYSIYSESLLINHDDHPVAFYDDVSNQLSVENSRWAPSQVDFNGRRYLALVSQSGRILLSSKDISGVKEFGWRAPKQINTHKAGDKVSLAVFNDQLFVAFKGSGSNAIYISSSYDGVNWSWAKQINNHQSASSPTLAVVNVNGAPRLVAGFRGSSSKNLYMTWSYDGVSWVSARKFNPQSSNAPYLTAHNGALYAAFKGASTENIYIMKSTTGGETWSTPVTLASSYRSNRGPAIASHNGELYLAFKGISTNNVYWTKSLNGQTSWSAPKVFYRDPARGLANKTSGSLTLYSSKN